MTLHQRLEEFIGEDEREFTGNGIIPLSDNRRRNELRAELRQQIPELVNKIREDIELPEKDPFPEDFDIDDPSDTQEVGYVDGYNQALIKVEAILNKYLDKTVRASKINWSKGGVAAAEDIDIEIE